MSSKRDSAPGNHALSTGPKVSYYSIQFSPNCSLTRKTPWEQVETPELGSWPSLFNINDQRTHLRVHLRELTYENSRAILLLHKYHTHLSLFISLLSPIRQFNIKHLLCAGHYARCTCIGEWNRQYCCPRWAHDLVLGKPVHWYKQYSWKLWSVLWWLNPGASDKEQWESK